MRWKCIKYEYGIQHSPDSSPHLPSHSTQAMRIVDDRFRHPECYTCTECGLNLRMRGHFWVGDVMYCEKHAKERYQGPSGSPRSSLSPRHWVLRHWLPDIRLIGPPCGQWARTWEGVSDVAEFAFLLTFNSVWRYCIILHLINWKFGEVFHVAHSHCC